MVSTQVWGKRLQRNSSPVLLTSLRSSNWHAMTTQTSLAKRFRLCKALGMWWLSTTRESLSENGGSTTTRRRSSSTSCAVHRMCRRSWQSIAIFTSTLFQVPQGVQTFFPTRHGVNCCLLFFIACQLHFDNCAVESFVSQYQGFFTKLHSWGIAVRGVQTMGRRCLLPSFSPWHTILHPSELKLYDMIIVTHSATHRHMKQHNCLAVICLSWGNGVQNPNRAVLCAQCSPSADGAQPAQTRNQDPIVAISEIRNRCLA